MPTVNTTIAEVLSRPISPAERARLAVLAARPDREIDFSDQEEITAEKIASGHYAVTRRGGARRGAGRKPGGKQRKMVKLSPMAIRRFQAYAKKNKLPHFSAALEAASHLL